MRYVNSSVAVPVLSDRQCLSRASAILLDWDGCVMIGGTIVPAAERLLRRDADRIVILSNNSTHLPEDFSRILGRFGVDLPAGRIVLAGVEALRWQARQPRAKVLLFGSPAMKAHARSLGLDLVRDDPEVILLMRDTRFTYAKLQRAINALHRGARLVVANGDRTHPGAQGRLVPETGALIAAIQACVPDADTVLIGKPGPLLFERACAIAAVSPEDAVMIGDNPDTDVKGAVAYGIRPILIGPRSDLSIDDLIGPDTPSLPRPPKLAVRSA